MATPALIATNVWAALGYLGVTVAAATGLAYWLFKLFSDKWLTAKFNERLEDYKHAQQRELEQLRFNINALMDRTVKLHQYEFTVLPELWGKLNDAFGAVMQFVSPMQSHPDLDRMGEAQLNEFIDKCELANWQKDELRTGNQKGQRYFKMIFWHNLNRVNKIYYEFNSYFVKNGIFLEPELREKIATLRNMLDDALVERQLEEEMPNPRPGRFEKGQLLRKEGNPLLDEIGTAVQNRLWNARSLDQPEKALRSVEGSADTSSA